MYLNIQKSYIIYKYIFKDLFALYLHLQAENKRQLARNHGLWNGSVERALFKRLKYITS